MTPRDRKDENESIRAEEKQISGARTKEHEEKEDTDMRTIYLSIYMTTPRQRKKQPAGHNLTTTE